MPTRKRRVFISYARVDEAIIDADIIAKLNAAGVEFFIDRDLRAGDSYERIFFNEIRTCDALLFAISPASCASKYCQKELAYARRVKTPIVPCEVVDTSMEAIPEWLRSQVNIERLGHPERGARITAAIGAIPRSSPLGRLWKRHRLPIMASMILFMIVAAVLIGSARRLPGIRAFHTSQTSTPLDVYTVAPDHQGGIYYAPRSGDETAQRSRLYYLASESIMTADQGRIIDMPIIQGESDNIIIDMAVDCRDTLWFLVDANAGSGLYRYREGMGVESIDIQASPEITTVFTNGSAVTTHCPDGSSSAVDVYIAGFTARNGTSTTVYTLVSQPDGSYRTTEALHTRFEGDKVVCGGSAGRILKLEVDAARDRLYIHDSGLGVLEFDLAQTTHSADCENGRRLGLGVSIFDMAVGDSTAYLAAGGTIFTFAGDPIASSPGGELLEHIGVTDRFYWTTWCQTDCPRGISVFNRHFFLERQSLSTLPARSIHEMGWDARLRRMWLATSEGLFLFSDV